MAIGYATVTVGSANMTLNNQMYVHITLTGAANGTVHGAVTVGDGGFPITLVGGLDYQARILGSRVHRVTDGPLFIVMSDDDGAVEYIAVAHTLTVAGPDNVYFGRPEKLVRQWLFDEWDTGFTKRPPIYYQRDLKSLDNVNLNKGAIILKVLEVPTKERGTGAYKDNEYPLEIRVMHNGDSKYAETAWDNCVTEVKRSIGLKWQSISGPTYDFVRYDNDGHDMSDHGAGRRDWVWKIRLMSPLRGRATTYAVLP